MTAEKAVDEVMDAIVDNYNYEHFDRDGGYAVIKNDAVLFYDGDGNLLGGEDNFTAEEV